MISRLVAIAFLVNLAGCSSCVKDDKPQATSAPDLKANPNKVKIIDRRLQPRISEEGGFLVPGDAGAHD